MAKLNVGDRSPDFCTETADGRQIRLSDYLGKKNLVVFFYPRDGSPVCTQEACAFRDAYEQFIAAGAEVLGVSSDTTESHREFACQHRLSFPLVSDAEGSLRKLFGVPNTLGLIPGRVTYVIDKAGIIRLIFSALFASEGHVHKALEALADVDRGSV